MIYLDSAATSVLKPESVKRAVFRAMSEMSTPGRGAHSLALKAAETVYDCRDNVARLCLCDSVERVVFTFNATHSLNIAINTLVGKGTKVLCSGYEHNSVMRPLRALGAQIKYIDTRLFDRDAFLNRAEELIAWADTVVCTHVSNVFGYILPVYELGSLCSRYGKSYIVDASQSAGSLELDFGKMQADFLCFPGHKGLMGPQGTGVLICKNEAKPLLYGGSGSNSLLPLMPELLPDRLEAGTHNTPGIAGLNEGVKYVLKRGAEDIRRHEEMLMEGFMRSLSGRSDLRIFKSPDKALQTGLVSILPLSMSCEALADNLAKNSVAVRAGLHCAPLAHESGGTISTGTVRFSFSPFISAVQARTAAYALEKILKNA